MKYKMSELVKLTNIPKSTILYYIKEGLLPEPEKLKPNVHLYSTKHLELLKYIKYMQQELNCSIAKLKSIFQNQNTSFSTSTLMLIPLLEALTNLNENTKTYSKEELLKEVSVSEEELNSLIKSSVIIPISEDKFNDRDLSILKLIENFNSVGVEIDILIEYAKHAKELAKLESKLQKSLCKKRSDENFSTLWHIQFETLFSAKSYIFNLHTYKEFVKNLKDEVEMDSYKV